MTQTEFLEKSMPELEELLENPNNDIAQAAQAHITWRTSTFQTWLELMGDCIENGFSGPGSNPETPPPPPPGT